VRKTLLLMVLIASRAEAQGPGFELGRLFTEPAATKTIAGELFISEAAVKQHLTNLFGKFGIAPDDENRRLRLANEAIRRGTVTISDLRDSTPS